MKRTVTKIPIRTPYPILPATSPPLADPKIKITQIFQKISKISANRPIEKRVGRGKKIQKTKIK